MFQFDKLLLRELPRLYSHFKAKQLQLEVRELSELFYLALSVENGACRPAAGARRARSYLCSQLDRVLAAIPFTRATKLNTPGGRQALEPCCRRSCRSCCATTAGYL